MPRRSLALHWKILIGLALGIVVGLAVNLLWTDAMWARLGVGRPASFLGSAPQTLVLPERADVREALAHRLGQLEDAASREPQPGETPASAASADLLARLQSLAAPAPAGSKSSATSGEWLDTLWNLLENQPHLPATTDSVTGLAKAPQQVADEWLTAAIRAIQAGQPIFTSDPNADAAWLAKSARFVREGIGFIGSVFMNGLRFIAVPIVLFSLVMGVSSLNDTSRLGRIGGKTIVLYLTTTAVAITVGLLLANLIGPGDGFDAAQRDQLAASGASSAQSGLANAQQQQARSTWDILLDIVPTNPFQAMAEGNTLQVVVAALLVGVALTMLPRAVADPVIGFFDGMTEVVIKIVEIILVIAPYAVFALLVRVVADLGMDVLLKLLVYCATVVLGLLVMVFGVYPLILRALTPVRFARFYSAIAPAQLLAFSSSSSGATLPVTMKCLEKRLGVKEEITSFVAPIGATLNMDGTALYQGVAAVFIAQLFGLDLTLGQQLQIVLTATLASIGTAAVPGVGIVMLVIVLEAIGMPPEVMAGGIAVIFGVDRILDMCRTACNVTGDCMVAAVVAQSEGQLLSAAEAAEVREKDRVLDEYTKAQEERERASG